MQGIHVCSAQSARRPVVVGIGGASILQRSTKEAEHLLEVTSGKLPDLVTYDLCRKAGGGAKLDGARQLSISNTENDVIIFNWTSNPTGTILDSEGV